MGCQRAQQTTYAMKLPMNRGRTHLDLHPSMHQAEMYIPDALLVSSFSSPADRAFPTRL